MEFQTPIEKPGAKQNFSAASKPWSKKTHSEKDLIKQPKQDSLKNIGEWRQRVPSSNQQRDPLKNKKSKQNLAALKERALFKDKKELLKEQERLKFYKVKFLKNEPKNYFYINFFIIIAAILGFTWFQMSYSKEVLKLEILGPSKADTGESITYTVKFKNNGNVRLENPELYFTFPDGAITENGQKVVRLDSTALKGDIYPGEERSFQFKARLMGRTNEIKEAQARMTFQPSGLKTKNEVKTSFTIILGNVPISLNIQMPDQVANNKVFTININYTSNVSYPLNDLTIKVQLPPEFTLVSQKPKGIDNEWNIPVLNEMSGGNIQLIGSLSGQDKDKKVFKAELGIWQNGNFVPLKEAVRNVEIIAPSIYLSQTINNSDAYAASPGDQLHYQISFTNIGQDALQDIVLISRLSGHYLDLNSVKVPIGNYQQGDNSIIWDGSQIPELNYLAPGQTGKVEFWVNVNKRWAINSQADINPVIKIPLQLDKIHRNLLQKLILL